MMGTLLQPSEENHERKWAQDQEAVVSLTDSLVRTIFHKSWPLQFSEAHLV
jgi:hypothetical protein